MSPQAKYNREVRKDPLIRMLESERQKARRANRRRELIETELQCWIWQLEHYEINGWLNDRQT